MLLQWQQKWKVLQKGERIFKIVSDNRLTFGQDGRQTKLWSMEKKTDDRVAVWQVKDSTLNTSDPEFYPFVTFR